MVKPGFSSNTAAAFRLLDEARAQGSSAPGLMVPEKEPGPGKIELIKAFLQDPASWPFSNDFLDIFLKSEKAEAYRSILGKLQKSGASFAGLSGSGSCCFGIYKLRETAEGALGELAGNFVKLTIFLAQKANPVVE